MCLSKVTKVYKRPIKEASAWKVFGKSCEDRLYFPCKKHNGSYEVVTGEWLTALNEYNVKSLRSESDGKPYPTGFHAFKTWEDAKEWSYPSQKIVSVKLREVMAYGTQNSWGRQLPVMVAKQLFVPTPRKRKVTNANPKTN
jgi:hypothetical protein